jgi:crotonobetaine/carnitine-CoA ligase
MFRRAEVDEDRAIVAFETGGARITAWTTEQALERAAHEGPSRIAAVFEDATLTYAELDAAANRFGQMLDGFGVAVGDRVAVLMANRLEYLVAYHGVGRHGAIFVPLVTQSKLPEIEYFIQHSEASLLVVDAERWETVRPAWEPRRSPALASLEHVVLVDASAEPGTSAWTDVLAAAPTERRKHRPAESDPVAFMYTSGSTGRPKAVVHSHYTAVAQAEAICDRMGYTPDDRLMTVFPLYHGNALVWSALAAVWAGARVIIHKRFSASSFWEQTRTHRATEVNLLVGAINMILAQPERPDDADNPVRLVLANVTKAIHDRFVERFDVDIVSTWALAEGPLGTMTAPGHGYRAGEIGWPMGHDNEVDVFDEHDRSLPPGVTGELVQRNRAMMLEYYKSPAETERVLRNGWVHSGDLGYKDEDGLFYFVGRDKHVIRRSGENVSGEEIEETLGAHPSIAEAAVFAVPDPIRGEEVKACVVLRPGAELTEPEIAAWVSDRLADFKVPRYVEIMPELPRTGPAKLDRPALARRPDVLNCWDRQATTQAESRS